MAREASSDVEDVGRRESERQMRGTRTKYLQDVLEQADSDHDDLLSMIEERQAASQTDDNFLTAIDSILLDSAQNSNTDETITSVHALLTATDALSQLNRKANHAIASSSSAATGPAAYLQARAEDQERVKQILAAGKRVFEGEIEGIRRLAGRDEAAGQAIALFGEGGERVEGNAGVERTVECLERGVKRMTRGLEGMV